MATYWIRRNVKDKSEKQGLGQNPLPTRSILLKPMKNKIKSMHVLSLIACIMGLISINYTAMLLVDYGVAIAAIAAILAILANIRRTK